MLRSLLSPPSATLLLPTPIHSAANDVSISGFSWFMPPAFPASASSFAVKVLYRAGSIADYGTTDSSIMTAAWTELLTADVDTLNAMATLPALSSPVTVSAGSTVSFWFLFTDSSRPMRSATPKLSSGYNTYQTTSDSAFSISYAMQV